MHLPLLLHIPSFFLFAPSPALLTELQILIPEALFETILIATLLADFFLKVLLGADNLLEFSALGVERLLPCFELVQKGAIVVVPIS